MNPYQSSQDSIPPPHSGSSFYTPTTSSQPQSGMTDTDGIDVHLQPGVASMMNAVAGGSMPDGLDSRAQQTNPLTPNHYHDHGQDLNAQYGTPDTSMDASANSRKRTKVSRACDECRRKKIKCDADQTAEDQPCSNCKRVNASCGFSRVPLKRGPSKGYIKELADRIQTIEQAQKVVPSFGQYGSPLQQRASEEYTPQPGVNTVSRKRTHSVTEDGGFGGLLPARVDQWNSAPDGSRQSQTAFAQSGNSQYSPGGLAKLQESQWRNAPELLRRQNSSFESTLPNYPVERTVDDATMSSYYHLIHPTFPVLPSVLNYRSWLDSVPEHISQAFTDCLFAAVYSFPPADFSSPVQTSKSLQVTANFVLSAVNNAEPRSLSTNILLLQMMLFLSIEAENLYFAGQAALRSCWLGTATSFAYSMKLHQLKPPSENEDFDSEENMCRRIWYSLVVMSRWANAGTASPNMIPDSAVVLYSGDRKVLGEGGIQLTRLALVLGEYMVYYTAPVPEDSLSLCHSAHGGGFKSALDRTREMFLADTPALVVMSFWAVKILVQIRLRETEPEDLLESAKKAFSQLTTGPSYLVSPLRPTCVALLVITLLDLMGYEDTKEEAELMLLTLQTSPALPARFDLTFEGLHKDRDTVVANQRLRKLADAATATGEGREAVTTQGNDADPANPGDSPFKYFGFLREHVHNGFLNAFNSINGDGAVSRGGS